LVVTKYCIDFSSVVDGVDDLDCKDTLHYDINV
jgi:hypothetical protein